MARHDQISNATLDQIHEQTRVRPWEKVASALIILMAAKACADVMTHNAVAYPPAQLEQRTSE